MAPPRATEVNRIVVRTILQTACVGLGLLSLISIATPAPTVYAAAGSWSTGKWEAMWTKGLTRYADDSARIDFDALKQSHVDLDRVVAFTAAVDRFPATALPG
jgi:hypothetical protein